MLEWKYNDNAADDNDDDEGDDDDDDQNNDSNIIIPISMMTRDELIQEENMLLQMAHTPIPINSAIDVDPMNKNDHQSTTIRDVLCQEWGQPHYAGLQIQFQFQK